VTSMLIIARVVALSAKRLPFRERTNVLMYVLLIAWCIHNDGIVEEIMMKERVIGKPYTSLELAAADFSELVSGDVRRERNEVLTGDNVRIRFLDFPVRPVLVGYLLDERGIDFSPNLTILVLKNSSVPFDDVKALASKDFEDYKFLAYWNIHNKSIMITDMYSFGWEEAAFRDTWSWTNVTVPFEINILEREDFLPDREYGKFDQDMYIRYPFTINSSSRQAFVISQSRDPIVVRKVFINGNQIYERPNIPTSVMDPRILVLSGFEEHLEEGQNLLAVNLRFSRTRRDRLFIYRLESETAAS